MHTYMYTLMHIELCMPNVRISMTHTYHSHNFEKIQVTFLNDELLVITAFVLHLHYTYVTCVQHLYYNYTTVLVYHITSHSYCISVTLHADGMHIACAYHVHHMYIE